MGFGTGSTLNTEESSGLATASGSAIKLAYEIKRAITSLAERDSAFVRAFADIAHAIIRDKAPRLADYEVGFQILDKDEENNRAVGIMAFKVGEQWLFVPFFFLNGDVRGHDILIVRDGDLMLPLKDNWIDYIFNTSSREELGKTITEEESKKGPRPDLYTSVMPYPLGYKYASDRKLLDELTRKARDGVDGTINLRWFVQGPQAPEMVQTLLKIARAVPEIAAYLEERYGIRTLVKDAMDWARRPAVPRPAPRRVRVYRPIDIDIPEHLKLAAVRYGFVVEDRRTPDELAQLIDTDRLALSEVSFTNPTGVGLYDGLVFRNGKLTITPVLVLKTARINPVDHDEHPSGAEASNTTDTEYFVVSLKDSSRRHVVGFYAPVRKIWTVNERLRIYGKDEPASITQALNRISRPLSEMSAETIKAEAGNGRKDVWVKIYLVSPDLLFTRIERYVADGDIRVSANENAAVIRMGNARIRIITTRSGRFAREHHDRYDQDITYYVPAGTRFMVERDDFQPAGPGRNRTTLGPARPEWTDHMFLKRGYYLKVRFDGTTYYINGQPHDIYGAPRELIYRHNLGEEDARRLLKRAREQGRAEGFVVRPKRAASQIPNAETDFFGYRAEVPARYAEVIPELDASQYDLRGYNPLPETDRLNIPKPPSPNDPDVQRMLEASRRGVKDVFDLAGISALTNQVGIDNIVSQYSRKVFRAMDTAGRLLFLFYRFRPEFTERIGESDAPRFENLLREVFDRLGDLSILLREKVSSTPEGERGAMDIESFQGKM